MLSKLFSSWWFLSIKKIRMITNLSELNNDILIVTNRSAFFYCWFLQKLSINAFLILSDSNINMDFDFWRKIFFYLFLDSSEQKWPQYFVKLLNNLCISLLFLSISHIVIAFVEIKPFIEILGWCKNFRQ